MNEYTGMLNAEIAGRHLLVDLWGVSFDKLINSNFNKETLINSAKKSCASVLNASMESFGEDEGVTGIVVLAESHISIHTWPEKNLATIDVYMCGDCDPKKCLNHIIENYQPTSYDEKLIMRGVNIID